MIKCVIDKIDGYMYYLSSSDDKYVINIEFYGVKPMVNDFLYLSRSSLSEKTLNIGDIDSVYGRKIDNEEDEDLVILETNGNKYLLKRIYG